MRATCRILLLALFLPLASSHAGERGWPALDQALLDLSADLRVACVAAHPDDEDSETLALLRRKWGVETWVVLATSGEGGQNETGGELYADLAALRRRETLRAAAITGARVDILGLPDFGYSRTASETFRVWGREETLRRLVRSLRKIRPHVVLTNHDTTHGHGHHQAVGIALLEAFDLAADPKRFPAEGRPWAVERLYVRCGREEADVLVPTGEQDPVRGLTYAEMGLRALKEHRSQGTWDWVKIEPGPRFVPYRLARTRREGYEGPILGGLPVPRPEWREEARRRRPRRELRPLLIALKGSRDRAPPARKVDRALALLLGLELRLQPPAETVLAGATAGIRPVLVNHGEETVWAGETKVEPGQAKPLPILNVRVVEPEQSVAHSVPVRIGEAGPVLRLSSVTTVRSHPPVEMAVLPWGRIFRRVEFADPAEEKSRFFVTLRNNTDEPRTEELVVDLLDTDRLEAVEPGRITIPPRGERWVRIPLRAARELTDGLYHVRIRYGERELTDVLRVIDVRIPDELNIGIVTTYGDEVVKFLRAIGIRPILLSDEDLVTMPLGDFNTIYLGIRPYRARPILKRMNDRLLEFVKGGGHLVVNYSKTREWSPDYAPYFLEVGSDRITEEDAPVLIREPDHRIFRFPNPVVKKDFSGWVQERGLYCPSDWDRKRYTVLLESADAGEPLVPGMLFARYGEGTYVYTTFVWYRQLRILNPGALKVVANLLSLPWRPR